MTVTVDDLIVLYPAAASRPTEEVQVFLDQAILIVTESKPASCVMSEERKDLVVKYLAIHFLSLSPTDSGDVSSTGGALKQSKLGDASDTYETAGWDVFGWNTTRWGQMAVALDPCGFLVGMTANSGLKAQFRVI